MISKLFPRLRLILHPQALARAIHADQRGSMSVMGVFTIFMLTVVLGMIFNMGRQVDDKLRMQNAADSAAYTGTITITRGMNAITYANHLLCEIFALTAYMREANQQYSWQVISSEYKNDPEFANVEYLEDLDLFTEWRNTGNVFQSAGAGTFPKFGELGTAIIEKIDEEQNLARTFRDMSFHHADLTLSVFEYLLRGANGVFPIDNTVPVPANIVQQGMEGGLIHKFQQSVYENTPQMAQWAADEIVERHGRGASRSHGREDLRVVMYRADATRFDEPRESNRYTRTLPVVNPNLQDGDLALSPGVNPENYRFTSTQSLSADVRYYMIAYDTRINLARHYLDEWIYHWMDVYFTERVRRWGDPMGYGRNRGSFSQMANFWRIFTCEQLNKLHEQEFPWSNLPFVIRGEDPADWDERPPNVDALGNIAYDHSRAFRVPEEIALERDYNFVAVVYWPHMNEFGPGVFKNPLDKQQSSGDAIAFAQAKMFIPVRRLHCCPWEIPIYSRSIVNSQWTQEESDYYLNADNWPSAPWDWSLFNQNWRTKMVPASNPYLVEILSQHLPELAGASLQEIQYINMH